MKINNAIYIVLLIHLFQYDILARQYPKYDQQDFENELDNIRKRFETFDLDNNEIDPNDRVDVDRWNQLNDNDIKNMPPINDYSNEKTARRWLQWYSRISQRYYQVDTVLEWNYETNITEENEQAISKQSLISSPFDRLSLPMAKRFNEHMKYSRDEDLKVSFGRLSKNLISPNDEDVKQTSKLSSDLSRVYSTTKVCELNNDEICYNLSPYLERLMQVEKDYDRLLWGWQGWHDGCGNNIRPLYLPYIDLLDKSTKENGYKDLTEYWISDYEMGNDTVFESIIDQILQDIMPLYEQIHGFVRGRLCEIYPNRFDCNGPIPAHILGNMWAQQWHERLDDFMPYPETPLANITRILEEKKYTIKHMYRISENFFTSINLYSMTSKFWSLSMFTKPPDRDVDCQPSASDMGYHNDYRVKICTIADEDYLYTIHHEMGHVEYYMSYAKQPFLYRDGANSGFHEAIGDTIGMYAISPTHLIKLDFIDEETITRHYEMNFLMRMALQKVVFLPYAYVMDKYRFALFRHQINHDEELNAKWWEFRIRYGGIMPPVERNNRVNFDPGAKYHISTNTPYARYFIAHILQFQFYRAMCRLQGQTKRLHMCDIYGNKYVGERFKEMLAMGNSKPWSKVLKTLTGDTKLESQAVLDFFQPLHQWLKMENLARGYPVGWM
ncbi:unnamed protein product [Rotaria magnacalcarata]|uniref:Angiotensin-converting enzyme n=4 Tax=Rotaria magnacalcarata TaxID=392030 RepID=A0A816RMI6_9BILA|nr:unnamed protein product [Rotaria magnacalcarata]